MDTLQAKTLLGIALPLSVTTLILTVCSDKLKPNRYYSFVGICLTVSLSFGVLSLALLIHGLSQAFSYLFIGTSLAAACSTVSRLLRG